MRAVLSILVLLTLLLPAAGQADDPARVMFLSSYHPAFPSFYPQVSGLREVLEGEQVELDVEFLDSKRFFDDANFANFTTLLKHKLDHSPPYDCLVVGDDNALNYAIKHRDTLFKGLPIVFLGINDVDNALSLVEKYGITGVLETLSLNETLDIIRQVAPNTRRIAVVTDATPSGQSDLKKFKEAMQVRGEKEYTALDLSKITYEEFSDRLRLLDPDDAILLMDAYRDKAGATMPFEEGLHLILSNAPCPVFHLWSHGMGQGLLGGKVIYFAEQGRKAGELVLRILDGEDPALIKVVGNAEANVPMFDVKVMKRFGLSRDRLPEDSILLNDDPPLSRKSYLLLLQTGGVILALVAVISYLLRVNRRKAAAEIRARKSEQRYRAYIDNAPDAVIIADFKGVVIRANNAASILTGYTRLELEGMSIARTLLSEPLQGKAAEIFGMLRTIPKISNSLEIVRKDGESAYILFDAAPLDDDTLVIFCKDLTELKKTHDALTKSEELFRGLLEQAGDAVFACNDSGQILFVNQAACNSLGYSREELEKLRVWDVDPLAAERNDPEIFWRRRFVVIETVHKRKDGTTFPVEAKMGTIRVAGESIVLSLVRDITVRKEQEQRIRRESEINLAQAEIVRALTAPDATLQTVAAVVHEWARRITGARFGYVGSLEPPENHLHVYNVTAMYEDGCRMKKAEMIFPARDNRYPSLWGHSLNSGKPFYTNDATAHAASRGLPEEHVPVEQYLSVPCRYEDELVGQIGLANPGRDFTDDDLRATEVLGSLFALAVYRKRAESELIRAKESAEAASRSKSEFLANVSHELRTPINGMFTMLKLAQETGLDGEQAEYVETAVASGRNLLQVVNDVLDLSRIEAGKIELVESLFFPGELMESVASIFRLQARDKGLEFNCEVADSVDEAYVGDQGRIRQILFNLVGNALKFTETGSISMACSVADPAGEAYARLELTVRDTGIGIPEDKLDTIFNSFEQVDGSYSRRYQGAGLGLGIVKRFTELMRGQVTVESVFGQGSTFTATVRVHKVQGRPGQAIPRPAAPKDGPPPKAQSDPLRLILAEDDRINRLAADKLLKKRGYVVKAVQDGRQVLEALDKEDYDCILMDVQMPNMDGLEATKAIRALPEGSRGRDIPIIALTAHAMAGDRENFLEAGMTDYLSKPMDIDALERMLARVTAR
jgi:PAS domain S-box-containing protein